MQGFSHQFEYFAEMIGNHAETDFCLVHAGMLTADFCHENMAVVFDCDHKKVYVAMTDPMNDAAVEKIRTMTGRIPQVFLARISEILNAIFFIYHEASQ